MAIDCERLLNWEFPEERHDFTVRDTILYALGVGLGVPADDPGQLRFVYEAGLRALPTMATMLGYRGFWIKHPATGIAWQRVLHSQQKITLARPLPVEGSIISRQRVSALIDRGKERGAVLVTEREIWDAQGIELIALVEQTNLLRDDGGFGKVFGSVPPLATIPERRPDFSVDLPTIEQAALLYRLSGDHNPLHADPEAAAQGGFSKPILHGLCTFGVVGHALLRTCANYDPAPIRSLEGKFTAPVYPGETIRTELWIEDAGDVRLRARSVERDVIVFDRGRADVAGLARPEGGRVGEAATFSSLEG